MENKSFAVNFWDSVIVCEKGMYVNGRYWGAVKRYDSRGLVLPALNKSYVLEAGEYFTACGNDDAFDGRYSDPSNENRSGQWRHRCGFSTEKGVFMQKMCVILASIFLLAGCAGPYNTQKGAAIGAGSGALLGQIIGRNTQSTLIGAGVGTLVGAIAGNAVDQSRQAAREAARRNRRVVYHDNHGGRVEAIPHKVNPRTRCRKVTTRVWEKGKLVKETVEEHCEGKKTTQTY